jgi:hypothetical protein
MKFEENYLIVVRNLTFYISLENKKNQNVETFDFNFANKAYIIIVFFVKIKIGS